MSGPSACGPGARPPPLLLRSNTRLPRVRTPAIPPALDALRPPAGNAGGHSLMIVAHTQGTQGHLVLRRPLWSACGLPPLSSPAVVTDSVAPAPPGPRLRRDQKETQAVAGR